MNERANTYTHGHHESVLRSHLRRTVENSAAYLSSHLRHDVEVLDVGCGPGTITVDIAERVAPGRVVGLDASDEVLVEARAVAAGRGALNVEFVVGDAYALQFDDESFDVVHAHQVLQHLSDPVAALVEMRRVCRPGGHVAVRDADYAAMTWYPESPEIAQGLELYRAITRGNSAEPDAGRRLLSWAHAAGFDDVSASASVWCFSTDDDRHWWGGLWADRLTDPASALARQIVDGGLADADALEAIAEGWRRWAADSDGWFAVLHGEALCRA